LSNLNLNKPNLNIPIGVKKKPSVDLSNLHFNKPNLNIPINIKKPGKPIKPNWPVAKPKWPKPGIHVVHVGHPVVYAAPAVYAVARPAVAGPCTCLSKEYTQEGAVLFKDRCTNEMAMNPPAQPQQVGMVEQPSQTAYVQQPQAQAAQQ